MAQIHKGQHITKMLTGVLAEWHIQHTTTGVFVFVALYSLVNWSLEPQVALKSKLMTPFLQVSIVTQQLTHY